MTSVNKLTPFECQTANVGQVLFDHCELRYRQKYNSLAAPCDSYKYRVLNMTWTFNTSRTIYAKDKHIETDYWLRKRFIDPTIQIQSLVKSAQSTWIVLAPIVILRQG